jgi:hypothetical protein
LPETLTRGDTYYIADGTYGAYQFDDAESGTDYIYLKKATSAAHGTETGWSSEYGDGVATWTTADDGPWVFQRGYYDIDGVTGGGPDAWNSGHGIKLTRTGAGSLLDFRGPDWWRPPLPQHITIQHVELYGGGQGSATAINGIYGQSQEGNPVDTKFGPGYITVKYCYLHEFGVAAWPINTYQAHDWLFEYNYVWRNTSTEESHGEGWQDKGSDHMVVRYNRFDEIEGTAVIALKRNDLMTNDDWKVHGNVFFYPSTYARSGVGGQGVFGDAREDAKVGQEEWDACPCTNILFYQNTVVRLPGLNSGLFFPVGSGNLARNNIWFECDEDGTQNTSFESIGNTVDHDYNLFVDSLDAGDTPGAHDVETSSDPFVDVDNANVHLEANTTAGSDLGATYNTDMDGKSRDTWSRGALEYDGSPATGGILIGG